MTFVIIASTLALIAATVAAQLYFRDAARERKRALKIWAKVDAAAEKVLDGEFPGRVREFAMGLTMTTGCGCYVRSVLIEHYTPSVHRARMEDARRHRPETPMSEAMASLNVHQRRQLDELVGNAIAFDMLSNPLQGWILRHAMSKRFGRKPVPSPAVPSPSREEREAIFRTVARKKPEICIAA